MPDARPIATEAHDGFVAGWNLFAQTCAGTVAPEATYQAWFAHFLMEHFGVLRVVREVDFGARHLKPSDQALFDGSNLRLDVCVLRQPVVYLPHRSALGATTTEEGRAARSGLPRLRDLAIISELKVAATVTHGLPYSAIVRDARKLQAILDAGKPLNEGCPMPQAYVCVLDNHPRWRLNRRLLDEHLQGAGPLPDVEIMVYSWPRRPL